MTRSATRSPAVALLVAILVANIQAFLQPITLGARRNYQMQIFTSLATPPDSLLASNNDELNPLKPGSTVALLTPFTSEGKIDIPSLRRLLDYHLESGTDNLCVLGTTAEAGTLSMDERATVLKTTVSMCKSRMPIMVGTGTINCNHVREMTQQALDLGADASLLVTPYYVKPPQRCLLQWFETAASHYGLPVVLYNVPGRTSVDMSDATTCTLASHENIVGLKDATGDLRRLASLKNLLSDNDEEFLLYSGDDGTSADFALQGGDGCISVTANVAAGRMREIMAAARKGDEKACHGLDDTLQQLHADLFCESNPIAPKWAAARLGLIDSAYCRPPLGRLDPSYEATVEAALRNGGLLAS